MLTRHHVVLGLLCSFMIGSAIAEYDPVLAVLVIMGCGIGLILPDIHMKRPRTSMLRTAAWGIVQAGKWCCIPLMCMLYRRLLKTACEPGDKRLTHSVPGIVCYFVILSGIVCVLSLLLENYLTAPMVMAVPGGLLMGLLLHLAEDLCTRKGIAPFYPFDEMKIVGSIRPCDVFDNRIFRFHIYHGLVLFCFLVFLYTVHWPVSGLIGIGFLGIGICVVSMVCLAEVRIEHPENNVHDAGEVTAA